eukprot:TRINITY_DN138_c0_g2_i1.p1 TRINITY_DN138_c0_g2~~TRINITY_DN138_c0_g2_i1.p1  ORF type:complete len:562 (+),score=101.96 TRINITY_DN138_c0_g2_i1:656-2341(+)
MDALAGRIEPKSLQGELLFGGEPIVADYFKRISAYVQQEDALFPTLTVYETLLFSASLRLPPSVPASEKKARVRELMSQLGLERVRNTMIGSSEIRGVSGGERRRVSIGVDIVHDPPVVFLDEPTSGLDSSSAFYVMEKLRSISRTGSLVMCTIHQPSFRILELLDRLLILSRGQVVYQGPPGNLPQYLASAGVEVPEHANNAEVIMDLIEERGQESASPMAERLIEFSQRRQSSLPTVVVAAGSSLGANAQSLSAGRMPGSMLAKKYANNFMVDMGWLMWRAFTNIRRSPPLFAVRVVNMAVSGLIVASIFWKPNTGLQGARNYISFMIFSICAVFFTSNDAIPSFILERGIFVREASHYAYRTSAYVIANMLVFLPFLAVLALLFTTVIWWSIALAGGAGGFWFFFLVLLLAFSVANSFVTLISALVPDVVMGNTVSLATTAYMLLLSGFFIQRSKIPSYWIWFHYLSNLKYPFEAMVLQQFDRPSCYFVGGATNDLTLAGNSTAGPNQCSLTGKDVLENLDVGQLSKWACCGILLALTLAYRYAFYIVLIMTSKSKRK